jgi:hypothetical protein
MILFLASDSETLEQLKTDASYFWAWKSMQHESDDLNFDKGQRTEIEDKIKQYQSTVKERLHAAYSWLLMPVQNSTASQDMQWDCVQMPSAGEDIIEHMLRKLRDNEQLIDRLSPKVLLMEIDKYPLWKDGKYIAIKELWESYTRRLFLQRLSGFSVLEEAIKEGIKHGNFFGYAEGIDETGRFQGLCLGDKGYPNITFNGLLVKLEAVNAQLGREAENQKSTQANQPVNNGFLSPDATASGPLSDKSDPAIQKKLNTRFYAGITLDPQKLGTTAGQIKNEILQHFLDFPGVSITVFLDVKVIIPEGTPPDVVRIINENCNTLNIKGAEFGDD